MKKGLILGLVVVSILMISMNFISALSATDPYDCPNSCDCKISYTAGSNCASDADCSSAVGGRYCITLGNPSSPFVNHKCGEQLCSTTVPAYASYSWGPATSTVCSGEAFTQTGTCSGGKVCAVANAARTECTSNQQGSLTCSGPSTKNAVGTKTCAAGQTCRSGACVTNVPACTPVACVATSTVACGQAYTNNCGTSCGTGTLCSSGTCQSGTCVVPLVSSCTAQSCILYDGSSLNLLGRTINLNQILASTVILNINGTMSGSLAVNGAYNDNGIIFNISVIAYQVSGVSYVNFTYSEVVPTCTDSDVTTEFPDGLNYNLIGTIVYFYNVHTTNPDFYGLHESSDQCMDDGSLLEFSCQHYTSDDMFSTQNSYACPYGCVDGACLAQPDLSNCRTCIYNNTCLPIGYRLLNTETISEPVYCAIDSTFQTQKELNATCQNNHECITNLCSTTNYQCVDVIAEIEAQTSLLWRVLCTIFHPFDVALRNQCMVDRAE